RLAFFKSLGTSAALMNEALLPMPQWFDLRDRSDCEAYLSVTRETIGPRPGHGVGRERGCLSTLTEQHSDDGAILQQLREWLLTGSLAELLEFHNRFAVHLMQRFGAGEFAR